MTRDEAIRLFTAKGFDTLNPTAWIDVFVSLGMLKLDEPSGLRARQRFDNKLNFQGDPQRIIPSDR